MYDSMNRPVLVKTYPTDGKTECVQYFYDSMGNVVNEIYGASSRISDINSAPENASVMTLQTAPIMRR